MSAAKNRIQECKSSSLQSALLIHTISSSFDNIRPIKDARTLQMLICRGIAQSDDKMEARYIYVYYFIYRHFLKCISNIIIFLIEVSSKQRRVTKMGS
jgi:hypothetical protein